MSVFRFKHFSVKNERSAMRVNTDGVLLGASMTVLPSDANLLDIGTGTGVIALMAAQRLAEIRSGADFIIEGIDIDDLSADEARENFASSPWNKNVSVIHNSLAQYGENVSHAFDLIFSNPPYFESSLKAPDARRCGARHAETMSYRDIVSFASQRLSSEGRLSLILPSDCETELLRTAAADGLYPFRIVRIKTVPRKLPSRIVAEFYRTRHVVEDSELVIQNEGEYTPAYRSLMSDFLITI